MDAAALVADWAARGSVERIGDDAVFVVDTQSVRSGATPPLLVLHGYPTSSIDFAAVLAALAAERRVVLLDYPGFGLSSKPDRAYSLFGHADVVEAVVASLGIDEVDLLTHDLGDSVGGELLARSIDGDLGFRVRRRVLTNGSIYMHLVQLSEGQKLLESLPDEAIPEDAAPDVDALERALVATLAPPGGAASRPDPMHVRAGAVLVVHEGGNRLLARQIRYIEERRQHESRWTGAIEKHPSPLSIVWGDQDPIAVYPMTDELLGKRPDARRTRLEGVGHYPMVEAPAAFSAAVLDGLGVTLRVVGAGLGRTGTHSLQLALQQLLGGRCYHMMEVFGRPDDIPIWHAAAEGTMPDWDALFADYTTGVDWPVAAFWREISAWSPDALVLLSVRDDADAWWKSASSTIFEIGGRGSDDPLFAAQLRMIDAVFARTFTPDWQDEDAAKAAYERHNDAVRAEVPADRLLEWHPGDGWEPICAALEAPVPDAPFPHVNTAADFRTMAGLDAS